MICKLKKVICVLKQSPKELFEKLNDVLITFGFKKCFDHSVFVCRTTNGTFILMVYIDDIIVTNSDIANIE